MADDFASFSARLEKAGEAAFERWLSSPTVKLMISLIPHSFDLGPPVLFETCLFFHEDVEPGSYIGDQKVQSSEVRARYRTWAEAEQGHMEICEELASALPAWNARSLP